MSSNAGGKGAANDAKVKTSSARGGPHDRPDAVPAHYIWDEVKQHWREPDEPPQPKKKR